MAGIKTDVPRKKHPQSSRHAGLAGPDHPSIMTRSERLPSLVGPLTDLRALSRCRAVVKLALISDGLS